MPKLKQEYNRTYYVKHREAILGATRKYCKYCKRDYQNYPIHRKTQIHRDNKGKYKNLNRL
jgi:hypothetical protein